MDLAVLYENPAGDFQESRVFFEGELRRFLEAQISGTATPLRERFFTTDDPGSTPESLSPCLAAMRVLGCRVAELHLALASDAPEQETRLQRRSLYQSLRSLAARNVHMLRKRDDIMDALPPNVHSRLLAEFALIRELPVAYVRIRNHGALGLEKFLRTGDDFTVSDFEGGTIAGKRCALYDVAHVLHSFHCLCFSVAGPSDSRKDFWHARVSAAFLASYADTLGDSPILPEKREHVACLLRLFFVEKCLSESVSSAPWPSVHALAELIG